MAKKYTATAGFEFRQERKVTKVAEGESFSPPEGWQEVPKELGVPGVMFQYPQYVQTVDETGNTEMEIPHYMILPLKKE